MLIPYISPDRLKSYEIDLKLTDLDHQIKAYHWSKELCSSIFPIIQCLEITLRNAINDSIVKTTIERGRFDADEWWFKNLAEYESLRTRPKKIKNIKKQLSKGKITQEEYEKEKECINKQKCWEGREIEKSIDYIKNNRKPDPSHGDVIAKLNFGFWINLLTKKYYSGDNQLLWPNLLPHVFPNLPDEIKQTSGREQLKELHKKFDHVRELRNRLFHHEPIWKFYNRDNDGNIDYNAPIYGINPSISILRKIVNEMLDMIEWISPEIKNYLIKSGCCDNFFTLCTKEEFDAHIAA